jgi:hypothetical protein
MMDLEGAADTAAPLSVSGGWRIFPPGPTLPHENERCNPMREPAMIALLAAGLALGGCATSTPRGGSSSSDTITTEQIDAYSGNDVYLLIQRLHPSWLRERGRASIELSTPVRVYINGLPRGGVQVLRALTPRDVLRIQYLDSRQATTAYGTGHTNGAILVTLR